MKTCDRLSAVDGSSKCGLEALWQVCLRFTPRWQTELPPVEAWTGLLVCGLHKDDVTMADLGDVPLKLINAISKGHADAFIHEVWFLDISEGVWMDPAKPAGEPTRL